MRELEVMGLERHFTDGPALAVRRQSPLRALDGVSFGLDAGRTLGVVGESGCGKSTLGRIVAGLDRPTAGAVMFRGEEINTTAAARYAKIRARIQMIFQDPYSSLNPRLTVFETLAEPMRNFRKLRGPALEDEVAGLLDSVRLPRDAMRKLPHEFSGGQRQRICIARALAAQPDVIVADEAVSALDVSVQAQIVNLLVELQQTRNIALIFISHDIAVVEHISDEVAVMYLGEIVEHGSVETVFGRTAHPYTLALSAATPVADPSLGPIEIVAEGEIPSPRRPPPGCRFNTRCPHARTACRNERPALRPIDHGHLVACHFSEEIISGRAF